MEALGVVVVVADRGVGRVEVDQVPSVSIDGTDLAGGDRAGSGALDDRPVIVGDALDEVLAQAQAQVAPPVVVPAEVAADREHPARLAAGRGQAERGDRDRAGVAGHRRDVAPRAVEERQVLGGEEDPVERAAAEVAVVERRRADPRDVLVGEPHVVVDDPGARDDTREAEVVVGAYAEALVLEEVGHDPRAAERVEGATAPRCDVGERLREVRQQTVLGAHPPHPRPGGRPPRSLRRVDGLRPQGQSTTSKLMPAACRRASRLSPIAWAVVTCPATAGLSSKARHSADSASIFAVSV